MPALMSKNCLILYMGYFSDYTNYSANRMFQELCDSNTMINSAEMKDLTNSQRVMHSVELAP